MLYQSISTTRLTCGAVGCAALTPSAPLALMPPPPSGANQPVSVSRLQMQLHLQGLQQSTSALRKQLSQLRNMQVGEGSRIGSAFRRSRSENRPLSGTAV